MEHSSVKIHLLPQRRMQPGKRREFVSPLPHPNPSPLSFKAETKRVPPFFVLFLNLSSKENHHSRQTLKTVSKVQQTQRCTNGHTGKTLTE